MKVLIAEDDPASRRVLATLLRALGHAVFSAVDGDTAWLMMEEQHFPVLISDWVMPGLDGVELSRRLRAASREEYTYCILLTGRTERSDYLAAMAAGVDDFLPKPLDGEQLAARLRVAERILALQQRVHRLEATLPTCSYCRMVRDGRTETWTPLETYIARRTETSFSHGVCPACVDKVVPAESSR